MKTKKFLFKFEHECCVVGFSGLLEAAAVWKLGGCIMTCCQLKMSSCVTKQRLGSDLIYYALLWYNPGKREGGTFRYYCRCGLIKGAGLSGRNKDNYRTNKAYLFKHMVLCHSYCFAKLIITFEY